MNTELLLISQFNKKSKQVFQLGYPGVYPGSRVPVPITSSQTAVILLEITSVTNRQTNDQTDRQTDRQTIRQKDRQNLEYTELALAKPKIYYNKTIFGDQDHTHLEQDLQAVDVVPEANT